MENVQHSRPALILVNAQDSKADKMTDFRYSTKAR